LPIRLGNAKHKAMLREDAYRLREPGVPVDRLQLRRIKVGKTVEVVEEELLELVRDQSLVGELSTAITIIGS
jgi:hypothetical protein